MGVTQASTYLLTRDSEETERLNEQHEVWTINNGYIIHPTIQKRLPKDVPRVADVAAGSGAWTLAAAKLLSDCGGKVDGYDISTEQFPRESHPNVTFVEHNAKEAFPPHLHEVYDLVHVRALVAGMDKDDWKLVVTNLMALLKPGGAIQWTEANLSKMVCLRDSVLPTVDFQAIPRLLELFEDAAGQRTTHGAHDLAKVFRQCGLSEIKTDFISSDRDITTRARLTSLYLAAILGWAGQSKTMTSEEVEKLRKEVKDEVVHGAYVRADVVTAFAIKGI